MLTQMNTPKPSAVGRTLCVFACLLQCCKSDNLHDRLLVSGQELLMESFLAVEHTESQVGQYLFVDRLSAAKC